ncbi:hypothetical protein F2Q69_00011542 [Brassica cretica]|uniref:Uncharacterized protein n=1 Tax=Brassica cretica TaxID=69181 RepID=A0A8S9QY31_BRACR|nr:hypothetical protein F2Q69_00011542 [Brassica cretica]
MRRPLSIDGNVSSTMRAVNDLSAKLGVLQGSIETELDVWLGKMKEEIQGHIALAVKEAVGTSNVNPPVPIVSPAVEPNQGCERSVEDKFYQNTIRNVMGTVHNASAPEHPDSGKTTAMPLSASSHTQIRKGEVSEIKEARAQLVRERSLRNDSGFNQEIFQEELLKRERMLRQMFAMSWGGFIRNPGK